MYFRFDVKTRDPSQTWRVLRGAKCWQVPPRQCDLKPFKTSLGPIRRKGKVPENQTHPLSFNPTKFAVCFRPFIETDSLLRQCRASGRLVAGLPPKSPAFHLRTVCVSFVVEEVALLSVLSPSNSIFPLKVSFYFHSSLTFHSSVTDDV